MALNDGLQSEITRSYNSFSGSDIRATVAGKPFAELQAISYSTTREKAPIYTLGSSDPRSFSRNKRGIAGSLIWVNFDRHALLSMIAQAAGSFVANKDDVRPNYRIETGVGPYVNKGLFNSGMVRDITLGSDKGNVASTVFGNDSTIDTGADGWKEESNPWFSDQIMPFDVTLNGCNENGAATAMKIFGVEILNEGSGVSIDDAVQEMQATFEARGIEPWQAVASRFKPDIFHN